MSAAGTHVLDAPPRLEGMAAAGWLPDDVAHEAGVIAAAWWRDAAGGPDPGRLVLVQVLQHRCSDAAHRQALRWDRLTCAGRPREAGEAPRWARPGPGRAGAAGVCVRGARARV